MAAGIFLSRVAGLIRERVFAHFFGNSDAGDAFKAALKIPNFLQNLFGEGVLSASFIPVYARLMARGEHEESDKVMSIVGSLLALATSILVVAGVWATPFLIDLIAPGFHNEKRLLTIHLVQIFFPGTGLLVMSAWCLGILNSHHKFFLSYVAPVLWNAAIIITLIIFGHTRGQFNLAILTAWGLVLGSALQFGIQLPTALRLVNKFSPRLSLKLPAVREVIRNFFPVVTARGVVQISAYIDNVLASFLPTGAVSALAYAQTIYLLPVSLFGMSVSAAELPKMSRAVGSPQEVAHTLQNHLNAGLKQIAFFVVPSVVSFLFLGDVIVSALFQTGEFTHQNSLYVWGVLAGATVGLLASTLGRLYASTFYALHDTRTPLRFALLRVFITTGLGYFFALKLPSLLQIPISWGTAGLTASAGIAGWVEFLLLRRSLNRRIGLTGIEVIYTIKLWGSALVAALLAWGIKVTTVLYPPIVQAAMVLIPYGLSYLIMTDILGVSYARQFMRRLMVTRI